MVQESDCESANQLFGPERRDNRRRPRDAAYKVIAGAFEKLGEDATFRRDVLGEVTISFRPSPDKCSVFIDGVYKGSSPLDLVLPAGECVEVKLIKAGHEPFEFRIEPAMDHPAIEVELQKKDVKAGR
ncbi:MAG: PEGA domain-containing protein [Planctomycetota bacterium]|nr:PEGA domain-containing protein [Planctomycetota bacterium]